MNKMWIEFLCMEYQTNNFWIPYWRQCWDLSWGVTKVLLLVWEHMKIWWGSIRNLIKTMRNSGLIDVIDKNYTILSLTLLYPFLWFSRSGVWYKRVICYLESRIAPPLVIRLVIWGWLQGNVMIMIQVECWLRSIGPITSWHGLTQDRHHRKLFKQTPPHYCWGLRSLTAQNQTTVNALLWTVCNHLRKQMKINFSFQLTGLKLGPEKEYIEEAATDNGDTWTTVSLTSSLHTAHSTPAQNKKGKSIKYLYHKTMFQSSFVNLTQESVLSTFIDTPFLMIHYLLEEGYKKIHFSRQFIMCEREVEPWAVFSSVLSSHNIDQIIKPTVNDIFNQIPIKYGQGNYIETDHILGPFYRIQTFFNLIIHGDIVGVCCTLSMSFLLYRNVVSVSRKRVSILNKVWLDINTSVLPQVTIFMTQNMPQQQICVLEISGLLALTCFNNSSSFQGNDVRTWKGKAGSCRSNDWYVWCCCCWSLTWV